ncbi:MAG: antibiotic biosynthesis monooxygenase [Alphaproteobacteria bacterium]|nr:antibiotic biosynthesis monooxygenase [Alphaproteobacteria bacterium]
MYVVTVIFELHPGQGENFLPVVKAQAENSMRLEDGCYQFDVAFNDDDPDTVFLYELYADRAAFDDHLNSSHYSVFSEKVQPMIKDKTVRLYGGYFRGA